MSLERRFLRRRVLEARRQRAELPGWLQEAYAAHKAGDLVRALELYTKVLHAEPRNAAALHYVALIAADLNKLRKAAGRSTVEDEAMRLMAAAIAHAPENAGGVHNFAKFKHDRGELEDARQLYETAVAKKPDQGESWTNLGNVYGDLGDRARAEECWNRSLECPQGNA